MNRNEPAFNLPGVVVGVGAALLVVHVIIGVLSESTYLSAMLTFGFVPARYEAGGALWPGGQGARIWTPLTYALLHGGWGHLLVNILWMGSFGAAVARRFGGPRFLAIFVIGALAGSLAHYIAMPVDPSVMIGASASVSGLTAVAARFAFAPGGPLMGPGWSHASYQLPAPSLLETLLNPRAMIFVGVWFAINLMFALENATIPGLRPGIAWQAHIGGFLVGFFLFGVLEFRRGNNDEESTSDGI